MIRKPEARCPRCGSKYAVKDAIAVSRHAETVIYYAECECSAANLTVTNGQVTDITPRDPIIVPDYEDLPIGNQEEPGYMAI